MLSETSTTVPKKATKLKVASQPACHSRVACAGSGTDVMPPSFSSARYVTCAFSSVAISAASTYLAYAVAAVSAGMPLALHYALSGAQLSLGRGRSTETGRG